MKCKKELNEKEKINSAIKGIKSFVDNFGENDVIKEAFLDILLEAIYGQQEKRDDIPLPSEAKQKDNKDYNNAGEGGMPTYEIE